MGWVKGNLADEDEKVKGLLITHSGDARIKYALEFTNDVALALRNMIRSFHGGSSFLEENVMPIPTDRRRMNRHSTPN